MDFRRQLCESHDSRGIHRGTDSNSRVVKEQGNSATVKKSRAGKTYGLPPLTITEAARLLGIRPAEFEDWLVTVPHSKSMWTAWHKTGVSPVLLQLYLTQQKGPVPTTGAPPSQESQNAAPERRMRTSAQTTPSIQKRRRADG